MMVKVDSLTVDEELSQLQPAMDDETFAKLVTDLETRGMLRPIEVNGKDLVVIDGHNRLRAAGEAGMEGVPIVVFDYQSREELKAHVLRSSYVNDSV